MARLAQPPPGSAAVVLTPTTPAADFAALNLVATVTSVSVNAKTAATDPGTVVNFKLATKQGVPVVGFGSTSKSSTATVASYPNLAFSLAKLIPASGGTPSKWVSYIVTTVPTHDDSRRADASVDGQHGHAGRQQGRFVHLHVLSRYPGIKALVDAMTVTAPNNKADLGDLTYDPA